MSRYKGFGQHVSITCFGHLGTEWQAKSTVLGKFAYWLLVGNKGVESLSYSRRICSNVFPYSLLRPSKSKV